MVSKNEVITLDSVFELKLTHADILDMMNDPDVDLAGGVDPAQILDAIIVRGNGSEISAGRFEVGDTLLFRFKKRTIQGGETGLNDVDVS